MDAADAKPLDLGTGRVCASFDLWSAAWLSLGAPHPAHGFVELSALPPFDESHRGDPVATRRHRRAMTRGEHAFLWIEIDGDVPHLEPDPGEPVSPRWSGEGVEVRSAPRTDGDAVRQSWTIDAAPGGRRSVTLHLRGALDRPALAEITELDPPMPTNADTAFRLAGARVIVEATGLPATARIIASGAPVSWRDVDGQLKGAIEWPDAPRLAFDLEVGLSTGPMPGPAPRQPPAPSPAEDDPMTGRALAYTRGCTALAVGPGERTILTDHRMLPLSWTRDAYWQALLLLSSDGSGDRQRVADHLRWLWRRCERPDGRWARSHHANGRRKDDAFQADQQLYPIIELADFWRVTGALPEGVDWTDAVAGAWSAALAEVDPRTGLIASAENAADDPAPAPFIAASQILLWYCAVRLSELADDGSVTIDAGELHRIGHLVQSAFDTHLGGAGGWAYASDGAGMRIAYHDANDLPVALAPLWGFCDPDDPGWRATMRFAFSPANPGFVDGDRPGLGSAHTPGPWTLGDVQAWIAARIIGDDVAAEAAVTRLHEVAFVDGMLPEAYAATGGVDRIRHWFAWPGAALAALRILERDGRLESRLSARPVR